MEKILDTVVSGLCIFIEGGISVMKAIETLNQKFNSLQRLKPKQKRLVRLGCAALALTLAVGAVPFIRSLAAGKTAVSDTDFVSGSDAATADNAVIMNGGTVEPKRYNALGGMEWVLANSLDELNHAALQSKSNIVLSDVTNWIESYLPEFMEQNGYDSSQIIYFVNDCTSSMIDYSYKHPQYGMQSVGTPLSRFDFDSSIVYYIPRVPSTSVTLSHTRMDLNVGDTETMTGELIPANTNDKIVWSSSDTTVATINNDGTVTAVGCGSTTITATVYNDVYEIPVTVSGQSFVNLDELGISGWVLATSWEEIKNAAYIDSSSIKSWVSLQRRKYPTRKWVYKYDPETEEAYQRSTSSGSFTEETFATMSNVYYIPKLPSYTYHPAQPATCTQHATIAYWTDQDGNKFLNANTENPVDSIVDETSPLGDHVWGEWLVTREPTCGESGEKKHTCSKCNTFETEPIDPDPTKHSLTHHEAVAATCTATGTKENWECSLCHKRFSDNAGTVELTDLTALALGHEWGSEAWNWASDYSSASVTLTCGRCHAEKTLTDNAPHIGTVVSQPTCTENKVVRYVANVQDDEDDTVFYSATSVDVEVANTALGHTWGNWVTDKEPTCEKPGEKHEECAVCHEKRSEHTEVEALGHNWGEWEVTTPATCEEAGEETRTCTRDASHKETREIAALGHNWGEWTVTKEATDTEAGEEERVCQNDPSHKETREIRAQPDDYSFTDDSTFKWKKGSKDGLLMVIENISNPADDPATFEKLVAVYVDGNKLTPHTDYTAEAGSIRLTLLPGYLNKLSTGEHTLKVVLTVTTIEHTFTVAAPAGTDTPSTGENAIMIAVSFVLLTFALAGCAFSFLRKRKAQT